MLSPNTNNLRYFFNFGIFNTGICIEKYFATANNYAFATHRISLKKPDGHTLLEDLVVADKGMSRRILKESDERF